MVFGLGIFFVGLMIKWHLISQSAIKPSVSPDINLNQELDVQFQPNAAPPSRDDRSKDNYKDNIQ